MHNHSYFALHFLPSSFHFRVGLRTGSLGTPSPPKVDLHRHGWVVNHVVPINIKLLSHFSCEHLAFVILGQWIVSFMVSHFVLLPAPLRVLLVIVVALAIVSHDRFGNGVGYISNVVVQVVMIHTPLGVLTNDVAITLIMDVLISQG